MISNLDKHCALELKKLRKSHKIKQQTMVGLLNLKNQQQYSDFENGKRHISEAFILKICSVFNISLLQFINGELKSPNLSLFLNNEDYYIIENSKDNDLKMILYKKLFLESKIENVENRLEALHNKCEEFKVYAPSKYKIYVIV